MKLLFDQNLSFNLCQALADLFPHVHVEANAHAEAAFISWGAAQPKQRA